MFSATEEKVGRVFLKKKKMKKMTSCLMKNLDVIQCQVAKNVGVGGGRERDGQLIVLTQVCNNTNLKHKKFHLVKICSEKSNAR